MRRDPEVTIARKAKKAGIDKAKYLSLRTSAIQTSAKKQGWRPSELAASVADIDRIADEVWGGAK